MIRASFKREGEKLRLTVRGHANYAPLGSDIVCSAASGLIYALAGYLINLKKHGYSINAIESGYADIACDEEYEEAMKLLCIGLIQLAATYPDCICVHNAIWRWDIRRGA